MTLPYWVETLLTMPAVGGDKTGGLVSQVGSEYLYPIVPPGLTSSFETAPTVSGVNRGIASSRSIPAYASIYYRLTFGYVVPQAFELNFVTGGLVAYDGRLTGYTLEHGVDYFYVVTGNAQVKASITNLTNMNQRFEMVSEYVDINTVEDYNAVNDYLLTMKFPYRLPTVIPGNGGA